MADIEEFGSSINGYTSGGFYHHNPELELSNRHLATI